MIIANTKVGKGNDNGKTEIFQYSKTFIQKPDSASLNPTLTCAIKTLPPNQKYISKRPQSIIVTTTSQKNPNTPKNKKSHTLKEYSFSFNIYQK
jgi:hypothetical protein